MAESIYNNAHNPAIITKAMMRPMEKHGGRKRFYCSFARQVLP